MSPLLLVLAFAGTALGCPAGGGVGPMPTAHPTITIRDQVARIRRRLSDRPENAIDDPEAATEDAGNLQCRSTACMIAWKVRAGAENACATRKRLAALHSRVPKPRVCMYDTAARALQTVPKGGRPTRRDDTHTAGFE